jgi:hypothetical protein
MNEQSPLPRLAAAQALFRCITTTAALLRRGRVHSPTEHVGMQIHFDDRTSARVYRETVVDAIEPEDVCVLLVEFQLRFVRGWWHTLFRWVSLLNTPLFVGFPGFVSKLWLTHDQGNVYRGIYDWNNPDDAEHYARALWRVLELGCVPGSIHYKVLPGFRRDEVLSAPVLIDQPVADAAMAWWRPISVE